MAEVGDGQDGQGIALAPEGREQAVEVLDVDLNVLEKEDVPFPAELGGRAAVEEVDERRQVAADGDPGQVPRRGGGGPVADDAEVRGVDLADEVLGASAPGDRDDQIELADGLLKDLGPVLDRGRDVVDLGVAREEVGAEVNVPDAQGLPEESGRPAEDGHLLDGEA